MKKMIILCMVFFVSAYLFSYEYIMNTNPSGIGMHLGLFQITTLTYGTFDDGYYDLAIPARNQFYYYGKLVTHLRISTNGYVVMGFGSASGFGTDYFNAPIPTPSAGGTPDNFVAPWWDDWSFTSSGAMFYEIVQNPDHNDYITIEWRNARRQGTTGTAYSFSCAFCSKANCFRPNTIIFVYNDVESANASYDFGKDATVGIENSTGTQGEQFSYNQAIITDGLKITFTPFVPIYGSTTDTYASVNDGYPDAIVFRPSNGVWYYANSDGSKYTFHWGTKGDVAVPGDYDGDGDSDEGVFRPSNDKWFITDPGLAKTWGAADDIPVPADYNGDDKTDIAVFRPSSGGWHVYYYSSSTSASWTFGAPGDIPLPADYDGDGMADLAVYRPSNHTWYIRKSTNLSTVTKIWGADGDVPMPTNFESSAYSSPTVFRPSSGCFYSVDVLSPHSTTIHWGQDGDEPIPGDENSGGITDAAVFRPNGGHWFISAASFLPSSFIWGTLGDKPRYRRSNLIVSPPPSKDTH